MQSARENHSKQLIYRQVYTHDQFVVFLNTTNNGYFLFTFVKKIPCNSSSPYQALLSINGKNSETVTFTCNSSDTAVYRVARKKFEQMQLTNRDLYFNLDLNKWDFNALKKDDYIQHNYRFFQKHSTKTVYPWNRD
ncbi:hypothetical protein FOF44_12730 [Vibrio algivorus]|uniref:Uncharacterized protein n=1 Tax=Vibrio algivorus TaxID=1667024 RepID=A0A557P2Q9_9VIBR|nr:hypothetical protein FOF44_12730 [Vibrio algivorus]